MITTTFTLERETKGALLYTELGYDAYKRDQTPIGTLYIRKKAFPDGRFPAKIKVTVEKEV